MELVSEEIFGFVVFLFCFQIEDEVIVFVNVIFFGFVVYFYIEDICRVWCVGEVLEFGMVGLNIGVILIIVLFFGGVK